MTVSTQQITDAQVHIGTLKREAHPKTREYWLDTVNGIVVLDPEKIAIQLENAKKKVQEMKQQKKSILVVCEKKMYADELEVLGPKYNIFFLNYKVPAWFLTNFDTLIKRIKSLNEMQSFMNSENFLALTKKEKLVYKRKFDRVNKVYKGVKNLEKRPDLVIIVDGHMLSKFVDELNKQKTLERIIITSTDFDDYLKDTDIIANMLSHKSIDFVLNYILS